MHAILLLALGADLNYPTPPNPFATGSTSSPAPRPPLGAKPFVPPPPIEPPSGRPGDTVAAAALPTAEYGGLLGGIEPLTAPPAEMPISMPEVPPEAKVVTAGAAQVKPSQRRRMRWRSTACLAVLSAACVYTRPHETSLITTLDAHREEWGPLFEEALGAAADGPISPLLNLGLGSAAVHGELVWIGLLGRWLPLLPTSPEALGPWAASVGAPPLLLLALTGSYLLSKLLPRGFVAGHLSTCFDSLLRRGRLYTLLTATVTPVGLVHWLHALIVLVVTSAELEPVLSAQYGAPGRVALLGWWAAAGVVSALSCVLTQLLFGRRAQPRSAVSGAAMGLLLLRAAALPTEPVRVGSVALPPLRCVVLHLLVDHLSNALPPPGVLGVEKLLLNVGVALLVATMGQGARELVLGAWHDGGGDWREMLNILRSAL